MAHSDRLTRTARIIVRLAWAANRLFIVGVVAAFLLTWIYPAQYADLIGRAIPGTDVPSAMTGARLLLLLGIAMAIVTDRLLAALADIIATASAGDPFIDANAQRLQWIGWCLLALQLCEIPGALLAQHYPSLGPAAPSGDIWIGGWIGVLMVFVLARLFAAGAAMRDDLAGTV